MQDIDEGIFCDVDDMEVSLFESGQANRNRGERFTSLLLKLITRLYRTFRVSQISQTTRLSVKRSVS